MLRAESKYKDGRKLIILGLSFKNLELLKEGKPILSDIKDQEVIMIHSEKDEKTLYNSFKPFIGKKTDIIISDKFKESE